MWISHMSNHEKSPLTTGLFSWNFLYKENARQLLQGVDPVILKV